MDEWKTWGVTRAKSSAKGVSSEEVKAPSKYVCGKCQSDRSLWSGTPFKNVQELFAHYENCTADVTINPGRGADPVVPSSCYPEFKLNLQPATQVEGVVRITKEFSSGEFEGEIYRKGRWRPFRSVVEPGMRTSNVIDPIWPRRDPVMTSYLEHYQKLVEQMWKLSGSFNVVKKNDK